MTTMNIPTTKTGLRKIALAELIALLPTMNLTVAEGATKPEVIDAILAAQTAPEPVVVETPEPVVDGIGGMTEDGEVPVEAPAETPMEIEATPKSLATLPTWIYFIDASTRAASTSIKRAYGDACSTVEREPTVEDFNRFAQNLKATGHATVQGAMDGESVSVSVYRARAI